MKGIICAGGTGSRLKPMTNVTNKHLLPCFDLPMIFYPIRTLASFDIEDVMIITGKEHAGAFLDLLGSGNQFGMRFTYRLQDKSGGIAEAVGMCKDFVGDENVAVILGDNIFEEGVKLGSFDKGAKIFLKSVKDPQRFGIASVNYEKIEKIVEKPLEPETNLAVTGLYVYDNQVWNVIKNLKPSARGELEITDVNNWYIEKGLMRYSTIKTFWSDAGTPESLLRASNFIKNGGNS